MTMEMWRFGFSMSRLRLALLLAVLVPFLTVLSHYRGFEKTVSWVEDILDAFVACGIAFVAAAVGLALFGVLRWDAPLDEFAGKLAIQVAPGGIGALLARSQFGGKQEEDEEVAESYGFEIFLMMVGALFLALNVAPTDEVLLIAFRISPWHLLALAALSLAGMHAFVYFLEFRGGHGIPGESSGLGLFLRFTVVGYAMCLLVAVYVLWTFGRTDGHSVPQVLAMTFVLSLPASIGAAAARLIL
jgi:putative integral membrane protein (TIGR02587 family)